MKSKQIFKPSKQMFDLMDKNYELNNDLQRLRQQTNQWLPLIEILNDFERRISNLEGPL
jgi:hypothetical protein